VLDMTPQRNATEPAAASQGVVTGLAAAGLLRVDPAKARWSRLLHDSRLRAALQQQLPQFALSTADDPPDGVVLAIELAGADETSEIEIAQADHPGLAMAIAPGTSEALRDLAAQALFEPVAKALETLGLGRWCPSGTSVRTSAPRQEGDPASPWLSLHHHQSLLATLRITRTAPGWAEAAQAHLRSQVAAAPRRAAWALSARVTLHTQTYSAELLASLAVGDVLVLPCPAEPAEPGGQRAAWPVVLRWGACAGRRLRVAARWVGAKVVIEGAHSVVNDEVEQAAAADEPVQVNSVGNIDVPVRFELETVPVALSEIEALAPGYVIELTSPLEQATVRLVVCGQVIGLAELVAVGTQLGARITRVGG
jgi:type III secretion protein Q